MSTPSTITPNPNGNPFDTPFASEMADHQQAQVATVKASSNGNPFDEPLASEKAEAAHKAAVAANPEQDASNTRQMLVSGLTGIPTPNITEQDKASFERGQMAGAVSVPIVAGAVARNRSLRRLVNTSEPSRQLLTQPLKQG